MGIPMNFTDVDDRDVESGGAGTPPGTYICKVFGAEEQEIKSGESAGQPSVRYGLKIIDGNHAGDLAGFDKLFFHSEKTQKRTKFILRRLGYNVEDPRFVLEVDTMNDRKVVVTTHLTPKCPECKWDVKPTKKTEDGLIYACSNSDGCAWKGPDTDVMKYTAPKYNGYELYEGPDGVGGSSGSTDSADDMSEVPF